MPPAKKKNETETANVEFIQKVKRNNIGIKFSYYNSNDSIHANSSATASFGIKLFTFEESIYFKIHQAVEVLQNNRFGTIVYATASKMIKKGREGYYFEIDVVGFEDFKTVLHAILPGTNIYSMEDLIADNTKKPFPLQQVMEEINRKVSKQTK